MQPSKESDHSVEDVERLFSARVISFMEQMKYESAAKFLTVVRNWRRATDERGLSDTERSTFNQDLLKFLLDDLMPWHGQTLDYSRLEVNRYVYTVHVHVSK